MIDLTGWALVVAAAYLPRRPCSVAALVIVLGVCVIAGMAVVVIRSRRVASIGLAIAAIALVNYALRGEEPGFRMLALVSVMLPAMKVVTIAFAGPALQPRQWLAFVGWFGMRPGIFTTLGSPALPGAGALAADGLRSIAIGAMLLVAATAAAPHFRWLATARASSGR